MLKSIFRGLLTVAGILLVGQFILTTFPRTQDIWEEAKTQFTHYYQLSLDHYGFLGTIIIILILAFVIGGNKR